MNTKQTSKWWIDALLFGGFLLAYFLDLTGLEPHQWLGLGVGALAAYHLAAHWDWVQAVTRRFLGRSSVRSRLYYLSDGLILAGFLSIGLSGLVLSTWFNLTLAHYDAWRLAHVYVSIVTLVLVAGKIALHARWIVTTAKKIFAAPAPAAQPVRRSAPTAHPQPARASQQMSRGDFLKLMGLVGAASVVALSSAASSLRTVSALAESLDPASTETTPQPSSAASTQPGSLSGASSSAQVCQAQCGHHCSFPGDCRKYRDADGNGRCDLGECA